MYNFDKKPQIKLRTINKDDLPLLWKIAYKDNLKWMEFDAPYFEDPIYEEEEFINNIGLKFYVDNPMRLAIVLDNEIIGTVGAYYEDGKLKKWLESGIVIYNDKYWNKGIGYLALKLFVTYLFDKLDIRRVGFTTWSGNHAMMKLGEKLCFQKEAQVRQVRYWNNQYWDSIKYGVLREEWKG